MTGGAEHLAATIAAHLREWDSSPAFVELAIFATDDATAIAQTLNSFCLKTLGAPVRRGLFHRSSIGSVTGVVLEDGRAVVIKAHQPEQSLQFLVEIVRIQSYLAERRIFATRVIAGPAPLGQGLAIVEQFTDVGATADAHEPAVRRALATSLHAIVEACDPFVAATSLKPALLGGIEGALWPKPHSKLFDFGATSHGAEWIDEIAALAIERVVPAGRRVIGHSDWRQEHVRFIGRAPVAGYDWDSLCCGPEPTLLGIVAHSFCADYSRRGRRQAPTIEEARAFKSAYEDARGRAFTPDESRLCGAAFAYACAYTARCVHSQGKDSRAIPGTFHHLVWNERANLLVL
jgi:hypothetical protein